MGQQCPRCGSKTVYDSEDNERLCLNQNGEGCRWWKDLDTGNEYPPQ